MQELLSTESLLTYLIGVKDIAHLQYLVFKQVQLDADPFTEVFDSKSLNLNYALQMIRMINQGTLVAHHLDVFLAIVVNLHIRVHVTVDVDWGHLRFQLLDVVKVLLRYVMCDAVKWALKLVVHGLQ